MFAGKKIDEFYSDSLSDSPLAAISQKAYVVKGDEMTVWPQEAMEKAMQQMKEDTSLSDIL